VREALGPNHGYSILKLGVYPIPVKLVRDLVNHCNEITVVEEGYPFIETRLNGLLGVPGKTIRGKLDGTLSLTGELTPDSVAKAFGKEVHSPAAVTDIPGRPPMLCKGCPHIDTYKAILDVAKEQAVASIFSDIGCYTLGCLPPYEAINSCVDMGASITMAHGASQAGLHPVLCAIGDSTFTHSGMTGLLGAAKADANMTVFLLDNATVAMTGGQQTLAAGDDLVRVVEGLGVPKEHIKIIEPLAKNHAENVATIKKEIEHRGLSVIVARRACIQIKKPEKAEKAK
jgi:indolepyruvate ferredoxin oxidoreductase, alpha subunit